jgi:hypothetical protein
VLLENIKLRYHLEIVHYTQDPDLIAALQLHATLPKRVDGNKLLSTHFYAHVS